MGQFRAALLPPMAGVVPARDPPGRFGRCPASMALLLANHWCTSCLAGRGLVSRRRASRALAGISPAGRRFFDRSSCLMYLSAMLYFLLTVASLTSLVYRYTLASGMRSGPVLRDVARDAQYTKSSFAWGRPMVSRRCQQRRRPPAPSATQWFAEWGGPLVFSGG